MRAPRALRFTPSADAWCYWCCARRARKEMFKLRDGPIDWYFCNSEHAELWCQYRGNPKTWQLLRTAPGKRAEMLGGRTTEDEISRLLSDECARSQQ